MKTASKLTWIGAERFIEYNVGCVDPKLRHARDDCISKTILITASPFDPGKPFNSTPGLTKKGSWTMSSGAPKMIVFLEKPEFQASLGHNNLSETHLYWRKDVHRVQTGVCVCA